MQVTLIGKVTQSANTLETGKLTKKKFSVISSSGLVQIQKDFTRNDKILDPLCTNKPDLFSDIRSIPGISDHEIILANCNLKPVTSGLQETPSNHLSLEQG